MGKYTWPAGEHGEVLTNAERRAALKEKTTDLLRPKKAPIGSISQCRRERRKARRRPSEIERVELPAPELRAADGNCCIYVMGAKRRPVKIGIAVDVEKRLAQLQTGFPYRLRVYATVQVRASEARRVERACHDRLHPHRSHGEWFRVDPSAAIAVVTQIAQAWKSAGYA
jgi:hypothetical protein